MSQKKSETKRDTIEYEKVSGPFQRQPWVDWMKGIALIWIFINHSVEAVFGGPYLGNPGSWWPPLQERIVQWMPLTGFGIWTILVNVWRYVGWLGDQGVSLFLVVSGFGLTWGILSKDKGSFPIIQFYKQRLFRIFPLWWGIHIFFLVAGYLTNLKSLDMSLTDPNFYLSFIGFRASPGTFFYFTPAWWYIGLLIQLYVVYPILWFALNKLGAFRFLLLSSLLAFIIRAGVIYFEFKVASLLYGAFFITRLPEFAFGMVFAWYLRNNSKQVSCIMFSNSTIFKALVLYIVGTLLSITWAGMVVAPFMVGLGIFSIFFSILGNKKESSSPIANAFTWIGKHSYSLYLVHHPIIAILVAGRAFVGTLLSILFTIIGAISLEKIVNLTVKFLTTWFEKINLKKLFGWAAFVVITMVISALGFELAIQKFDPQEVIVWGEQPSLAPNPNFGWYLKPNQTTRLRWESYDYYVTANELGFPGPSYPESKAPGTIRILTLGDAFTSAEGVNTDQAWPRLLESFLVSRLPNSTVEVLNFAITGYGPNQYAEVAKTFIPKYHPDIVIIGFYMNDYLDVLESNADFQSQIGFGKPSATSWYSTLRLSHTRHWLHKKLDEILDQTIRKPDLGGYFSGAEFLLRNQRNYEITGQAGVAERFSQIKSITDSAKGQMIIFMVPAPVQICGPDEITYYPINYDLSDKNIFDLDKPQRMTQEITKSLNILTYDLRTPFQFVDVCPYQPRNLHWTVNGHKIVAEYIADVLIKDKLIPLEK
jgi:peptidoglycan/LPS O-acetylase OafA/YrhL